MAFGLVYLEDKHHHLGLHIIFVHRGSFFSKNAGSINSWCHPLEDRMCRSAEQMKLTELRDCFPLDALPSSAQENDIAIETREP